MRDPSTDAFEFDDAIAGAEAMVQMANSPSESSLPPSTPNYHVSYQNCQSNRGHLHSKHIPRLISGFQPRLHPHLAGPYLYISSVPHNLPTDKLATAMRECMAMHIELPPTVINHTRLRPDAYYDWMPRNGILHFADVRSAEKALAILQCHPNIIEHGIFLSPYEAPLALPFPDPSVAARYIRPYQQTQPLANLQFGSSPEAIFMAQCPSPGELFEAVRPWGSIRQVGIFLQPTSHTESLWFARVEFWYNDEARRFDVCFGETGSTIKGWQVKIVAEKIPASPTPMLNLQQYHPANVKTALPSQDLNFDNARQLSDFGYAQTPHNTITPPASIEASRPIYHNLPWRRHDMFLGQKRVPYNDPLPSVYPCGDGAQIDGHVRVKAADSIHNAQSPRRMHECKQRWSVATNEAADGVLMATGLVSQDGTYIAHGPGQHIRPAPPFGPGSSSASGLVDYSNVFVKGLDPDINSYSLCELFGQIGTIISARVMRDGKGYSRGYGFVSFNSPEEAMQAVDQLHDQIVGRRRISVTLHEPRKLRPEKLAERRLYRPPTVYGRQNAVTRNRRSSSPVRTNKRGTITRDNSLLTCTIDGIRSLSPASRRETLAQRIDGHVQDYARSHDIPKYLLQPAIDALVSLDLALIPLLHDSDQLDVRIAEMLNVLQESNEVGSNAMLVDTGHTGDLLPENESTTSPLTRPSPSPFEALSLDTMSLSTIAVLPVGDIVRNITSPEGGAMLDKLFISRPTSTEVANLSNWLQTVNLKSAVERRSEITGRVAKRLETPILKRSQKAKIAADLVKAEDDDNGICQLLLYPALLEAKVHAMISATGRRASI